MGCVAQTRAWQADLHSHRLERPASEDLMKLDEDLMKLDEWQWTQAARKKLRPRYPACGCPLRSLACLHCCRTATGSRCLPYTVVRAPGALCAGLRANQMYSRGLSVTSTCAVHALPRDTCQRCGAVIQPVTPKVLVHGAMWVQGATVTAVAQGRPAALLVDTSARARAHPSRLPGTPLRVVEDNGYFDILQCHVHAQRMVGRNTQTRISVGLRHGDADQPVAHR